jgi:predicted methyltransferase
MASPAVLGGLRSAILPPLIVCSYAGQPPRSHSEEDRAAELKKRAVKTLQLGPGDTAADVDCGDGFYTIPMARFIGPSRKVCAEYIT